MLAEAEAEAPQGAGAVADVEASPEGPAELEAVRV